MKKILLFSVFSMIFLCCASCADYQKYKAQQLAIVANSYMFPAFSKVAVSGNARVELVDVGAGGGKPYLYCKGTKQDVDKIGAEVKDGTLYISSVSSAPYIKLSMSNPPHAISVANSAYVKADDITSRRLTIATSGAGSITLQGTVELTTINQTGNGKIDVKWIDSKYLNITSNGQGPIYLAGHVKNLEAQLYGRAYLEARYLRADEATIISTGAAQVHVLVTGKFDAYADQNSNIYYHKRPQQLNKVTKDSGNVLLMEEIP